MTTIELGLTSPKRRRLDRVTAACDLCKKRKVKCDGEQPCAYCQRKNRASTCAFTVPKAVGPDRAVTQPAPHSDSNYDQIPPFRSRNRDSASQSRASVSPTVSRGERHEDTVVPLEGRILRDAQGKVIFIGDCAPLSFLQTVRYLITSEVDPEGFTLQAARDSIIEVTPLEGVNHHRPSSVISMDTQPLVNEYVVATSGLVELFEHDELLGEIKAWASTTVHSENPAEAVFYLVLAIGAQESSGAQSETWFSHAKEVLLKSMCNAINVPTVQGFVLVAVYMLRAFQPNGASLFFSLAARTAYAIGIHRAEVNASFGEATSSIRKRIWKSLRVVDMLISNVLGRPPSTSDVDCTVKYKMNEAQSSDSREVLDASVQILMIIERIVVEVYSRKRISLRIANYVSRQLKTWAAHWQQMLLDITTKSGSRAAIVGACSVLCSYHYGILLLTRPFLMYDLYEYMGVSLKNKGTEKDHQDKRKYADAALESAASLVEMLTTVIRSGTMPYRLPLVVSWLFTTSLVLAVGILGRSGLVFEEHCNTSIECMSYFGKVDPTARQYSLITQSLLEITTNHVKMKQIRLRMKRKQASSQLFGLLPSESNPQPRTAELHKQTSIPEQPMPQHLDQTNPSLASTPLDWTIYDTDSFALSWPSEIDQGLQDFLQPGTHNMGGASVADIPLFPIYDQHMGASLL